VKPYRVVTNGMSGADVQAVKGGIVARLRARRFGGLPKAWDSTMGPRFADMAGDALHALGAAPSTVSAARHGRLTVGAQRMLLAHRRTPAQLARATARLPTTRRRAKASRQPGPSKPRIVRLQAAMANNQGSIGALTGTVGHYTAGPRPGTRSGDLSYFRQYNAQHRGQGWGAIGYHYGLAIDGTILLLRPASWRGCHTAGANTGRLGIVVNGGPGQRMTAAQRASYRWLLNNAHTSAMPASHRASARLSSLPGVGKVHKDYNATSCAGDFTTDYRSAA